jgi:flagellar hook-associated protein FlgK
MSSIPATALSGLSAAQRSLQVSAHNVANLGTDNFRRQELLPTTNHSGGVATSIRQAAQPGNAIETDLVNQLQAKNAFLANLAVFRANDRMAGSLLDAVG